MAQSRFPSLIGVIHLPALPGAPGSSQLATAVALQQAGLKAVREAQALTKAGFDGIILENFGDVPFYKDTVPAETVASMSIIAAAVREATRLPLGINILRNDARAALAVAAVAGCQFIRVNVLSGVAATDQGIIEGHAAELIRERERLAPSVAIFADAHVKHAQTLSSDDIALAVEETGLRARADAVIVTGATTGRIMELEKLTEASRSARAHGIPLYIGSGSTAANLPEILPLVDGIIVGSALRKGGVAGAPLDTARMRNLVRAFRARKTRGKRK